MKQFGWPDCIPEAAYLISRLAANSCLADALESGLNANVILPGIIDAKRGLTGLSHAFSG